MYVCCDIDKIYRIAYSAKNLYIYLYYLYILLLI
nr:MAG TPA: hypothetical protein [Caudoviricetes sp.]